MCHNRFDTMELNLEFWKKVQEEFVCSTPQGIYMCVRSKTFSEAWPLKFKEFVDLGQQFLNDSKKYRHCNTCIWYCPGQSSSLFFGGSSYESKAIREDFVTWNIKRLEDGRE